MMPLLTMPSMTGVAALSAASASSCLPALRAKVALRMALRSCEVRASLRARCAVDWRAAFSADFVLAKRKLLKNEAAGPKRPAKEPLSLRPVQRLVNEFAGRPASRLGIVAATDVLPLSQPYARPRAALRGTVY